MFDVEYLYILVTWVTYCLHRL